MRASTPSASNGSSRIPTTRYRQDGVIALDNTLIDHDGKLIEDVGYFWDHADKRHLIAHDYLFTNYVNPSGKHYPLDFRRFRKREQCDDEHPFKNHTDLAKELIDWVVAEAIPGDFTFDSYFTNAPIMNHIHSQRRSYIGDLKANRAIMVSGQETTVSAWVKTLTPAGAHQVHGCWPHPMVFHQVDSHPQGQPSGAYPGAVVRGRGRKSRARS